MLCIVHCLLGSLDEPAGQEEEEEREDGEGRQLCPLRAVAGAGRAREDAGPVLLEYTK